MTGGRAGEPDPWSSGRIRYVAHRGGGCLAPENTLAGIRVAAAAGFAAVEFDVMLSGGGSPILIHDETLERTTNGTGRVAATSDAVLAGVLANRGFESAFPDEPIAALGDALALCSALGIAANVEIKPAAGHDEATARAVAAVLRDAGPGDWLLSSFSESALAVAGELLPSVPRALLVGEVPVDWERRLRRLGGVALHASARQPDWSFLAAAAAAAIAVRCYTVNDVEGAEALLARGVSALFTDALDRFGGGRPAATSGYIC